MRFHRGEPATARSESENDPRWQRLHAPDIGRFKRRAGIGMPARCLCRARHDGGCMR